MKAKNQMTEQLKEYFEIKGRYFSGICRIRLVQSCNAEKPIHIALQNNYQKRMARHLRRMMPFLIFNDTY